MTNAVLYARYSTAMQSRASVEDQLRLLRQRAEREGWSVIGEFSDHAVSGSVRDRPGLNSCLTRIESGAAEVLVAEALDRVSRDQEDIAGIYKRIRFHGGRIVTLSEGEVGSLQVGMGGTISAVYIEQLAEKTKRGQIGRVEAGRIPGGLSYGYRPVRAFNAEGKPEAGLREIDEEQAAIVRRIFTEYAAGSSPLAIAKRLNAEGIPAPRGSMWRANTIGGHRERRTGILYNDLYRGRIVYNRQTFRKDPDSRRRVSRPNDAAERVVGQAPELRIIDDELWARVEALQTGHAGDRPSRQRRPRRLLSGMLTCGECGGNFIAVAPERWGCSNARQTGTCTNTRTLFDTQARKRLWCAVEANLLHPEVIATYLETRRQLLAEERHKRIAQRAGTERRLAELAAEQQRIASAIVAGVPPETVRDRAMAIIAEREQLINDAEDPVLAMLDAAIMHPATTEHYRRKVSALQELVDGDEALRNTARALLQSMIVKIEVTPAQGRGCDLLVHGDLAAILALPESKKGPANGEALECMSTVVAGAGFEPATFRL